MWQYIISLLFLSTILLVSAEDITKEVVDAEKSDVVTSFGNVENDNNIDDTSSVSVESTTDIEDISAESTADIEDISVADGDDDITDYNDADYDVDYDDAETYYDLDDDNFDDEDTAFDNGFDVDFANAAYDAEDIDFETDFVGDFDADFDDTEYDDAFFDDDFYDDFDDDFDYEFAGEDYFADEYGDDSFIAKAFAIKGGLFGFLVNEDIIIFGPITDSKQLNTQCAGICDNRKGKDLKDCTKSCKVHLSSWK